MGATTGDEVATLAEAMGSQDPEVGLRAAVHGELDRHR